MPPTSCQAGSTSALPGATLTTGSSRALPERLARGSSITPSTTSPSRSGAASSSACLMASSRVEAEAGQPSQLPSRRMVATPSAIPSSSTLPPWDSM